MLSDRKSTRVSEDQGAELYETRLVLGGVLTERAMPDTAAQLARMWVGSEALMAAPAEMI